ncbi:hypothetical protein N9368_04860 [Alphaproteobacteria bacterium]|nr:hypothetical protein [Alphaproteobacteria bacterium]
MGRFVSIGTMSLACILLFGCDSPDRIPNDVDIADSLDIVRDKVIAPIKGVDDDELTSFDPLPRRKLLQVQHSPQSLSNNNFVKTVISLIDEGNPEYNEDGTKKEPVQKPDLVALDDAAKEAILDKRAFERTQILVNKGLQLETTLLDTLRVLDDRIDTAEESTIGGLGGNIPVFGRNLTEKRDGYLELPNDLVFVGGENGTFSSKTAILRQLLDNPVLSFSVREMPLPDAMDFLFQSIGLQAAMSDAILDSKITVTLSVEASAIAIMDALMEQHGLAIVYDRAIEVAQVYTQEQFDLRMVAIRQSIENYNAAVKARAELAEAQSEHNRISEVLQYAQLLLGGDDQGFIRGIESISRAPAAEATSKLISTMTREALALRSDMIKFDKTTDDQLSGKLETAMNGGVMGLGPEYQNILSEDECIWPGQEIFTEKMTVYNAVISDTAASDGAAAVPGVASRIRDFFDELRPSGAAAAGEAAAAPVAAAAAAADGEAVAKDTRIPEGLPSYCGTSNPASLSPRIIADETGITVIGTREDNDLVVNLLDQYDVPQLQVLIEIFIITVSRDFSRQVESFLSVKPSGGGNGVGEAEFGFGTITAADGQTAPTRTELLNSELADLAAKIGQSAGAQSLRLQSPNQTIGSLLTFLETNKLARVVSSPTVLVAEGAKASIERTLTAKVEGPTERRADNTTFTPIEEYPAPFLLRIDGVGINRLNNTVKLDVYIEDTRFNVSLANVRKDSDETSDKIKSVFWAAPGDIVVLAGLTRNSESTNTSGLPGTTGSFAPLSPALGGSDAYSTALSETIVFMAPTVIDPSADLQPHSAFRTRDRTN